MSSLPSIDTNIADKLRSDREFRQKFFYAEASVRIAQQLIALRKRRHLNQMQVAEMLGTGQPAISRVEIDDTRVVHLLNMRRRAGQAYWPEVAAKLVGRYSFIRYPSIQDLTERREFIAFGVGKFADSQIQELKVYGDGLVVNARSNSNV